MKRSSCESSALETIGLTGIGDTLRSCSSVRPGSEAGSPPTDCRFDDPTGAVARSGLPKLETEDLLETASSAAGLEAGKKLSISQFAGVGGRDGFDRFEDLSARSSAIAPGIVSIGGSGAAVASSARLSLLGVPIGVNCRRRCWLGS